MSTSGQGPTQRWVQEPRGLTPAAKDLVVESTEALDRLGRTIKGRYRLLRVVGQGGMGAVYGAEHVDIGRRVAVKVVHSVHAANRQLANRLKQEARAASAIESENVVQILDAGEDEEHGLFVVMELLQGEDLEAKLRREKRLAVEDALGIAEQTARGLARAHARGIIHRDLKPANVFLSVSEDGEPVVKLVDFGIAKLIHDAAMQAVGAHAAGTFTTSGCVIGTPRYMSPEQAQGLLTIDGRTDVYSLGALLYEMLVGEPPVPELDNYEQKILHIVTKPRPGLAASLPDVDPALARLVDDMMALEPDHRPPNMAAVRERLAPLRSRTAISEPPPPRATSFFSTPPPPSDGVDDPVSIPFSYRTDARRIAWGAAVLSVLAIGIGTVSASAGAPPHVTPRRTPRTAVVLRASGLETTAPVRVHRGPLSPAPTPAPVPTPGNPRPLGGTGITQEF